VFSPRWLVLTGLQQGSRAALQEGGGILKQSNAFV
jgi:hypothetical protein